MENKIKDYYSILALPYIFFVSAMYHVGFWNQFNINILNYLGLQDLINGIVKPIINNIISITSFTGLILAIYVWGWYQKRFLNSFKNLKGIIIYIIISLPLAFILIMFIMFNYNQFLIVALFVFLVPLLLATIKLIKFLKRKDFFNHHTQKYPFLIPLLNNLKYKPMRNVYILLLTIFPIFAYSSGYIDAKNIISGESYQFIDTTSLKENDIKLANPYKYLIFLGKGGGIYFFSTPDFKNTYITEKSDFSNLVIQNGYPFEKENIFNARKDSLYYQKL